jgi:hypothetical protein
VVASGHVGVKVQRNVAESFLLMSRRGYPRSVRIWKSQSETPPPAVDAVRVDEVAIVDGEAVLA